MKGFAATRMEDVATCAGVSKGTLYLYFDSKESLFRAVIQESLVPVLDDGADLVDTFEGSSGNLLRALMHGWWLRIGDTPLAALSKLIVSESGNFPELAAYYHDEVILRGRSILRRALQRGIAVGEFRDVDLETAIDVIFAPVLMMVIWRNSMAIGCGTENNPSNYLQSCLELTLGGLSSPLPCPVPA